MARRAAWVQRAAAERGAARGTTARPPPRPRGFGGGGSGGKPLPPAGAAPRDAIAAAAARSRPHCRELKRTMFEPSLIRSPSFRGVAVCDRLAVEPGAQPAVVVFQEELAVALAGDAGVLGFEVSPRVAEKAAAAGGRRGPAW